MKTNTTKPSDPEVPKRLLTPDAKKKKKPRELGRNTKFYQKHIRPCVSEFIASFFFVCIGCLSVQNPLGANIPLPSAVAVSLSHGLLATTLIIIFGRISGAHFNPAITLACIICKETGKIRGIFYMLFQTFGSIAGGITARLMMPADMYAAVAGGAHILTALSPVKGILVEMVLTFLVVLTFLHTGSREDEDEQKPLGPVAVGFSVTTALLAGIGLTGGSVNPIRSFGSAVALTTVSRDAWTCHYVYWIGPFSGAILASFVFKALTANIEKRCLFKKKRKSDH